MIKILYGVGKSVLRQFTDLTKIIAFTKLKDLQIEFTGNEEKIYGGDSPYPFASMPKDKAIKVTAENATFDLAMMNATQGAVISTGKAVFDEILDVAIPADGILTLEHLPLDGSVIIQGYTPATDLSSVATGKYFQDATDKSKFTFAVADADKNLSGVYQWETSVNAETMTVTIDSLSKPFKFVHRMPVYDDNNNIVAEAQLTIFKAKANNNFTMGLKPQTAFAPKLELEAQDAKRADKKLWDYTVEPVV